MSSTMELNQDTLQQIGEYVKQHLPEWQRESVGTTGVAAGLSAEEVRRDIALGERIVRVEEELKTQRDLIREGFDDVNKRFEEQMASINARFDDVNRRFEDMHRYTNRWMVLLSLFLAMIGAMPWLMGAY